MVLPGCAAIRVAASEMLKLSADVREKAWAARELESLIVNESDIDRGCPAVRLTASEIEKEFAVVLPGLETTLVGESLIEKLSTDPLEND